MTLQPCPECRQSISSAAASCPHCGYPLTSQPRTVAQPPQPVGQAITATSSSRPARGLHLHLPGKTDVACFSSVVAVFVLYLALVGLGLANSNQASLLELPLLALPLVPILPCCWWLRTYRSATAVGLLFLLGCLILTLAVGEPYLFGELAQSNDGAGMGMFMGLVFLWQWLLLAAALTVGAIAALVERRLTPPRAATRVA